MGMEIERKFLVNEEWNPKGKGIVVRQGYLPQSGELLVRIRRQDDKAYITLKGRTTSITRAEYEYEIPVGDADELFTFCSRPLIEKERYIENFEGHIWEVDKFFGENDGLIVAEIELKDENEKFEKPSWLGKEVSGDARYYNSNLIKNPFKNWK